jgi:hypothetical protein
MPKPLTSATVRNPDDRLICYRATLAKKLIPQNGCGPLDPDDSGVEIDPAQDAHQEVAGIHVNDQFGPGERSTVREMEICVPSLRTP